jgi:hypothetical protein
MIEELEGAKSTKVQYPIQDNMKSRAAGGAVNKLRARYVSFWSNLAGQLIAQIDNASGPTEADGTRRRPGIDTLQAVVDQLLALSSNGLMNIRDAVTEACLVIGKELVRHHMDLRDQVRQVGRVEVSTKSTGRSSKSQSYSKNSHHLNQVTLSLSIHIHIAMSTLGSFP